MSHLILALADTLAICLVISCASTIGAALYSFKYHIVTTSLPLLTTCKKETWQESEVAQLVLCSLQGITATSSDRPQKIIS